MKQLEKIVLLACILVFAFSITIIVQADEKTSVLTQFNSISNVKSGFVYVTNFKYDKLVVHNSSNTLDDVNGLINLKGQSLLSCKYKEIELLKKGYIRAVDAKGKVYMYDKHMTRINSKQEQKDIIAECRYDDYGKYFIKPAGSYYKDRATPEIIDTIDPSILDQLNYYSLELYGPYACNYDYRLNFSEKNEIITCNIETKQFWHAFVDYSKLSKIQKDKIRCDFYVYTYFKDIKAYELTAYYADSGIIENIPFLYIDFSGNDVFENNYGIVVEQYLGDGYYIYTKNNKTGIGLLPSYKERTSYSIKSSACKSTKVVKVWKKKKSSKKLKLRLKKVKKAKGYQVKVYSKKKALVYKNAKKTTITVKSKKIANKKKLFVKARCYAKSNGKKKWSKWSKAKKVKLV